MRRDRHSGFVDRAGMPQQQIAVIHRQRQRAAGLKLAADQIVDAGDHGPQRRHRQMHVGKTLVAGAIGAEERLVEFQQHHRARPHGEFAAAMDHQGFAVAGVAREAIAVVIGLQHLAAFAPHRGEGAVAAAEHGGADMDRIHRGAERHVGGRIELAGIGKMLEQFGKGKKALPVVQTPRQHVGRQRFLDDGHRAGLGKDLEWERPGGESW